MKEQFHKLAEQAVEEKQSLDEFIAAVKLNPNGYYGFSATELEKFAELIVEKCLDVVAIRLYRGTEEICRQECKAIAAEIKQHFGVEE